MNFSIDSCFLLNHFRSSGLVIVNLSSSLVGIVVVVRPLWSCPRGSNALKLSFCFSSSFKKLFFPPSGMFATVPRLLDDNVTRWQFAVSIAYTCVYFYHTLRSTVLFTYRVYQSKVQAAPPLPSRCPVVPLHFAFIVVHTIRKTGIGTLCQAFLALFLTK